MQDTQMHTSVTTCTSSYPCNRVVVVAAHVQRPPSAELSGGAVARCPCDAAGLVAPAAAASLPGGEDGSQTVQ